MPVEARRVELVIMRQLRRRFAGREPPVDLRALHMLASPTNSTHGTPTKRSTRAVDQPSVINSLFTGLAKLIVYPGRDLPRFNELCCRPL